MAAVQTPGVSMVPLASAETRATATVVRDSVAVTVTARSDAVSARRARPIERSRAKTNQAKVVRLRPANRLSGPPVVRRVLSAGVD